MFELSIEEKIALVKRRLDSLDKNLSEEQLDFILHPISLPCYLKACPGSGKTEVVGIKAAYEIADWKETFNGIAVLSFTKNAAKEIGNRVKKYGGTNATQHPHFIGTIDSWLHNYILQPFGHIPAKYAGIKKTSNRKSKIIFDKSLCVIESKTFSPFLLNYDHEYYSPILAKNGEPIKDESGKDKLERKPTIKVDEYYFNYRDEIEATKKERDFPLNEIPKLKSNKLRFLKDGFATYQDAEYLCYKVLSQNINICKNFAKRFPYIIIDECQDLSQSQLRIFHLLIEQGVKVKLVGDINQAIYDFKRVFTDKILNFIEHHKFALLELSKNYRSMQKIVDVCCKLESINSSTEVRYIEGKEPLDKSHCILWEYKENEISSLPIKFLKFIKSKENIKIENSAIVARGRSTISEFKPQPNNNFNKIQTLANGIHCWNIPHRNGNDIQNALNQVGKSISQLAFNGVGNSSIQFCPEDISALEWRNFLWTFLKDASLEIYPFGEKTWTVWTNTCLKPFLQKWWSKFPSKPMDWDKAKHSIKSPVTKKNTKKKKNVEDEIKIKDQKVVDLIQLRNNSTKESIRITTIHDVKGETLDAVLVVSSKDRTSKGGHYEHWLTEENEKKEYVRFAYVASSRPRNLLIWAIPWVADNPFIEKIKSLGFKSD